MDEEVPIEFDEADDAALEADDELEMRTPIRQARRPKKKLSVFKDPILRPALTYLQVSSLTILTHCDTQ